MAFLLGFAVGRFPVWAQNIFGRTFSQESEKDHWELRRFAYLAYPAIQAIERHNDETGQYPESLDKIEFPGLHEYQSDTFYPPGGTDQWPSFTYSVWDERDTYFLEMKFNLEDGLRYHRDEGKWVFWQEMDEWDVMEQRHL